MLVSVFTSGPPPLPPLFFLVISLLLGCIIYPAGWDHAKVREICDSEKYKIGVCHLKWAYTMAMVLVVDQLILSTLGFVLANKKPPHIPEIQFKYGTVLCQRNITTIIFIYRNTFSIFPSHLRSSTPSKYAFNCGTVYHSSEITTKLPSVASFTTSLNDSTLIKLGMFNIERYVKNFVYTLW